MQTHDLLKYTRHARGFNIAIITTAINKAKILLAHSLYYCTTIHLKFTFTIIYEQIVNRPKELYSLESPEALVN